MNEEEVTERLENKMSSFLSYLLQAHQKPVNGCGCSDCKVARGGMAR